MRHDRSWPLKVRTTRFSGFLRLKLLAGLKFWRPRTLRFAEEEAWIERWLGLVERTLAVDPAAAREVVATAALVRGYADTYKRGLANWSRIMEAVVEPGLSGALPRHQFADAVLQARLAAVKDPEGEALGANDRRHRTRHGAGKTGGGVGSRVRLRGGMRIRATARWRIQASSAAISLLRHVQAELGAAPDHVLGRARPLVLDQVAHLRFRQRRAEMPAELRHRPGLAEHGPGARAVGAHQAVRRGPRPGTESCAPVARQQRSTSSISNSPPGSGVVPVQPGRQAGRSADAAPVAPGPLRPAGGRW